MDNYRWKLDEAKKQGNDWVRILFEEADANQDFTFSNRETFKEYDEAINYARSIGLNVMGQILDSSSWPKDITVEKYRLRTINLVTHYQNRISVWEIGNEINGNWLIKKKNLDQDNLIIDSVKAAADEVKRINNDYKTVITLYWSEGTSDYEHSLFLWINKWESKKNFGKNIDIIALSIYPANNPVGSAFDITIQKLREKFPDKKIMIGEFDHNTGMGYWWHSDDVSEARKDLVEQYYTAMMGYDYSINGGFWWYFYDEMIKDGRESELYYTLQNNIKLFKGYQNS